MLFIQLIMKKKHRDYLRVLFQLLFKVFFMPKCIKMIFFYFLKIIFEINTLKRFKIYKKLIFYNK
jgi:hypothetical protein